MHATVEILRPRPPDTYPPIDAPQGGISPVATGLAGAVVGALAGAGYVASKKLSGPPTSDDSAPAKAQV
jgi:hypothetical protein